MKLEQAKHALEQAGQVIEEEKRLPNDTGHQLKLESGAKVNVFDKGTFNVQGKNKPEVEAILRGTPVPVTTKTGKAPSKEVFVVYGHDGVARAQLDAMLRRWGLEPLILDQLPSEGQTVIEKLEHYMGKVQFAVVLSTPDDEGHRTNHPDEKKFRARQNVVLELGMLLSELGRAKVAVLMKNPGKMERPSDIQGLIYISFNDDLEKEAGLTLAKI
jgi:predicted nucleotide-binding protein